MKPIATNENRLTLKQIRLRIPKQFHRVPVISDLVSLYHVTVNITAAILGTNARSDGWFDLELRGTEAHIQAALEYLNRLGLEVLSEIEVDGW